MTTPLSTALLLQLSERIELAMGVYFPTDRLPDLERKIRLAARELAFLDAEAFVRHLLSSPLASEHIRMLAGYLTIGETYFCREPQVWAALRNNILPLLIASRAGHNQSMRFWSAACSTGEEPYTLAMTLTDVLPHRQEWQCLILATDLNPNAIRRARDGVYGSWSFRSIALEAQARFFNPIAHKQFAIHPDLHQMVTFAEANLISTDPIPNSDRMDVIFCRNVLFYFAPERMKYVLQRAYDCLVDGGWLIVSPVEAAYVNEVPFVPVLIDGITVFRKDASQACVSTSYPGGAQPMPSSLPALPSSYVVSPIAVLPESWSDCESIQQPETITTPTLGLVSRELPTPPQPLRTLTPYEQAQAEYAHGQYAQVIALLLPYCRSSAQATPHACESHPLMLLARAYANQGQLTEAREWCEKAIALDRFNTGLHYLLATILLEQDEVAAGIRSLQKAIYVRPDFVLAHFALGNLLYQQHRYHDAKRHLISVLGIVQHTPHDEILPESEGLTVGRLVDLVNAMLRR